MDTEQGTENCIQFTVVVSTIIKLYKDVTKPNYQFMNSMNIKFSYLILNALIILATIPSLSDKIKENFNTRNDESALDT